MNNRDRVLISVLMAAYKHEHYIEEAVKSIWEQSCPDIEIIVIDDASGDATYSVIERLAAISPLPMKAVRNDRNMGIAATMNRALGMAEGEFVAFLDSDDVYAQTRFETQLSMFAKDPELMLVFGNGRFFSDGKKHRRVHSDKTVKMLSKGAARILRRIYVRPSPFFLQTALVRKEFLDGIGGFDSGLDIADWVLNIRMFRSLAHTGRFAYVDEDLFYHRMHGHNTSSDVDRYVGMKLRVIDSYTPQDLLKTAYSNLYWSAGWTYFKKVGDRSSAYGYFVKSLKARPGLFRILRMAGLLGFLAKERLFRRTNR